MLRAVRGVAVGSMAVAGTILLACSTLTASAAPGMNVIDQLVSTDEADAGTGWAVDPGNPGGGGVQELVEGPATPPSGRGSLELTTPSTADRAQVYINPAGPVLSSWTSLVGEAFSTFTFATVNPGSNLPTMKFAGWQAGTTAGTFTTLTFGQPGNGPATAGVWQRWTLAADSMVFQSNAADAGFCVQATPCTFGDFLARYPTGLWGQMQIGLGSGAGAGSRGFADDVSVTHGDTSYSYDFEVPSTSNSTATIQQGAPTSTGGEGVITLNASAVAADSVTFTITVTLPDGSTTTSEQSVAAGLSATATIEVPFGTTAVTVSAQGVSIATGTVSFAAAAPTPTPTPTLAPPPGPGPGSSPELAVSGSGTPTFWIPAGLVLTGIALLVWARTASAGRRRDEPTQR